MSAQSSAPEYPHPQILQLFSIPTFPISSNSTHGFLKAFSAGFFISNIQDANKGIGDTGEHYEFEEPKFDDLLVFLPQNVC